MEVEGLMDAASTAISYCNLVRVKVAAVRLGVSVRTLYRIIAEGGLPLVHIRGCSCLKEGDLQNYIEKNKESRSND
jgi:excisionase family DNA binding protein